LEADTEQKISEEAFIEMLKNLLEYTENTEIPIMTEFYAKNNIFRENLTMGIAKMLIKLCEQKKRAALERKIYSGELNATIGVQLLKQWREDENPKKN